MADPKAPGAGRQAPGAPGALAGPTEDELRQVVLRADQLRQQLAAMEQQRDLVLDLASDARRAFAALDHLATAKAGDEALLPIGAGAFVHATLADPTRAITSLGAGVHAEVPIADARDRMKARADSLEGAMTQLNQDMTRVADELERLNALLEQVYAGGA